MKIYSQDLGNSLISGNGNETALCLPVNSCGASLLEIAINKTETCTYSAAVPPERKNCGGWKKDPAGAAVSRFCGA